MGDKFGLLQASFGWLAKLTTRLAAEDDLQGLDEVGAELLCLSARVRARNFTRHQLWRLEQDDRIEQALSEVENAISLQTPTHQGASAVRWPNLHEIASSLQNRYGVDHQLEKAIEQALRRFPRDFEAVIQAVRACSDIREHEELPESFDLTTLEHDDLPCYAKHAQTLFRVLSAYASCNCPKEDEKWLHWARLRLKPVYSTVETSVPFDMVFSAEPNPTRTFDWQEARIFVPTKTKTKKTTFLLHTGQAVPYVQAESWNGDPDSQEIDSLCELIRDRCGVVLRLKVLGERLNNTPALEETRITMVPGVSGTTLGELMQDFKMQSGMRPVLAYAIAKAVWHYYDSDRMPVGITSSRVYFMEERYGQQSAYFCKPYVSVDLQSGHGSAHSSEQTSRLNMLHRWPKILALGIMLIEIATGRSVGMEGPPESWEPRLANDRLFKLKRVVEDRESFQPDCNNPSYKAVVRECLDPRIFTTAPFIAGNPTENRDKRREILYEKVVAPLRKFIQGAQWDREFQDIETTPLEPKKAGELFRPGNDAMPVRSVSSSVGPSSNAGGEDQAWLNNVAELNLMIQKMKQDAGASRKVVKIAILDTGYDKKAPAFRYDARNRIKAWRDFVSQAPDAVDEDGHGTHLLALFFRMRCLAHIYVARVTKSSAMMNDTEENVAEAIQFAARDWGVDFVSMSLGFPTFSQSKKVQAAITSARSHNKNITFFAAANNEGLNESEMYPARLGQADAVLPIRGTYSNGSFHPSFNPPPTSPTEPAFGTLGYNVYSDSLSEITRAPRAMSGCSVATPIAVALAVMLIDYASSQPSHFSQDDLDLLRTRRGVFEVFKEISEEHGEGRYYVAPFTLFKLAEDVRRSRIKVALGKHPERF